MFRAGWRCDTGALFWVERSTTLRLAASTWKQSDRRWPGGSCRIARGTGVERVYLRDFRVGALLAALAVPDCDAVAGLITIAPVVSGRRYAKELRTTHLAAFLGSEAEESLERMLSDALAARGGCT